MGPTAGGDVALGVVVLTMGTALALLGRRARRLRRERDVLLQEKDVVFSFVHNVGEVFADADSVDVPALLKRVLFYALRTTKAGAGALYLVESDGDTLRLQASSGVVPPLSGRLGDGFDKAFSKIRYAEDLARSRPVRMDEGVIGEVATTGLPVLIQDAERDPRLPRITEELLRIHTLLAVPMRFHGTALGVLVVLNRVDDSPFIQSDQNLLQALADQASAAIYYARFGAALDEKRRLDFDLSIAHRIQAALLPKEIPRVEGAELGAFSVPAQQIGGDYYDFFEVDDEHLGVAIADVVGKGVTGALVMALCRSVLRMRAPGCRSPAEVLRTANALLSGDLSEDMFVTMLYMVLNRRTRELRVARAGHLAPILNPGDGSEPREIAAGGVAIGLVDAATFNAALEEQSVTLRGGDVVVAYTDGVTDAKDQRQNEWGPLNLIKSVQLAAIDGLAAPEVAGMVRQRLLQFVGDTPQYDDMTLVVMRMAGREGS
jgi:sigma-B regulation protein RsbU (phosphoserine phosphatase)